MIVPQHCFSLWDCFSIFPSVVPPQACQGFQQQCPAACRLRCPILQNNALTNSSPGVLSSCVSLVLQRLPLLSFLLQRFQWHTYTIYHPCLFNLSLIGVWGKGILKGKCPARSTRKLSEAVPGWGKLDLISVLLLLVLLLLLLLGQSGAGGWLLAGWLAGCWLVD